MWIGFKQIVSVEREAEGVTAWTDSAITPNLGSHDGGASSFGGGLRRDDGRRDDVRRPAA